MLRLRLCLVFCIMARASLVWVALIRMSFRPYLLGITAFTLVSLWGEVPAQAPATTDFTLWKDSQNAESVPDWARRMLSRDFRGVTGADRDELLAGTLSALKDISSDSDVVPSTRYNAILAAGHLVSLEPSPGNPPIAYPAALSYLIEVYQKPDVPHYLQYGALLGIVRHAHSGIDPEHQDTVVNLLLETAITEFSAAEVTLDSLPLEPAAWDWFRLTALDGLSALKTVGTNNNVITELLALINRKAWELEDLIDIQGGFTREEWEQSRRVGELASKAAKTLGDLDYTSATDVDAKRMTDAFIRLTKTVCELNLKMVIDLIEPVESTEPRGATPNPVILLERIVTNMKMCTQSVGWGIRGDFLTASRPAEHSFYASLGTDDPAIRRLDILWLEIIKLAVFLDEGVGTRRPALAANVPREFQFNLSELRDALERASEAFSEILREEESDRESTPKSEGLPDVPMSG